MKEIMKLLFTLFLAQLSHCAYTIIFRKSYIASLESWTTGLLMAGLLGGMKSGWLDFGLLDHLTIIEFTWMTTR